MESSFIYYFTIATTAIIPLLSLLGNLFVLVIFLRKKLRDLSMSRYLCALAICDFIEVASSCMLNVASIVDFTVFYCKLSFFFCVAFFTICNYLRMIVSIDRIVFLKFSKKFSFRNSIIFQLGLIVVVVLIGMAQGSPYYIFYDRIIVENDTIAHCTNANGLDSTLLNISNVLVSVLIPFIGMVTCSILVWKMARESRKKFSKESNKATQLLKSMLGCDLFFFFFNIPISLYTLAVTFLPETYDPIVFTSINAYSLFNNTFAFIVYFLSNNLFRNEIYQIIGKKAKYVKKTSINQQVI